MDKLIIKTSEIDVRSERKICISVRIPPEWLNKINDLSEKSKREFSDVARIVFGFGLERAIAESDFRKEGEI